MSQTWFQPAYLSACSCPILPHRPQDCTHTCLSSSGLLPITQGRRHPAIKSFFWNTGLQPGLQGGYSDSDYPAFRLCLPHLVRES